MGIVYEDRIKCHGSAYFSVDRTVGIQYNTNVCVRRENIFAGERT